MIDPGLSEPRKGVRVSVKYRVRLDDKLTGAQMPPKIRIGCAACRHGDKTQGKDSHEYAPRLEEIHHSPKIIPRLVSHGIKSRRLPIGNNSDAA